jgi:predicted lysophospholipase L1 biosynthesis ABC-type transport system permease subunit
MSGIDLTHHSQKGVVSDLSFEQLKRETDMTTNMGMIDRTLRLIVAAALFYAALVSQSLGDGGVYWVAIAIATIFAVTALVGTCPLYSLLGIKTSRTV